MPQFLNEYEGVGNALMGLGAQYSARLERDKEEKRRKQELLEAEARRKAEKLEDRAYAEGQVELERKRTAPLDAIKMQKEKLALERERRELVSSKTTASGGMFRTETPTFNPDGSFNKMEVTTAYAPPKASTPRSNAHRTVVRDGRLMQFNDATQAYDKDLGAAGTGKGTAQKDPLDQGMALMDKVTKLRTLASELGEGHPDKAAFTQQANELEGTGKALMQEGMRRMKGGKTEEKTSSGVLGALGAGFSSAARLAGDTLGSTVSAAASAPKPATGTKEAKAPPADDYDTSFAQVKQARPNWTDSMITDYLSRKGITKKG